MESPFLNEADAAAYCHLSKGRFGNMRRAGGGPPYYQPGKYPLYLRSDLDAWITRFGPRGRSSAPVEEAAVGEAA